MYFQWLKKGLARGQSGALRGKSGEAESIGHREGFRQLHFLKGHDICSGLKRLS